MADEELKAKGNECFRRGKYNAAIECYTQAIDVQASAALYSNRAAAHVKRCLLEGRDEWSQVEADCRASVHLDPRGKTAHKAYYNLTMALTKLGQYAPARDSLASARDLLGDSDSDSTARLEAAAGALRRAEWEAAESQRWTARSETLQRLQQLVSERGDASPGATDDEEQLAQLVAEEEARRTRDVPDWLCCKITMDIMRDPVITPDGISYERQVLLAHLSKSQTDPFTRQPLTIADLRPNLGLKEAAGAFLKENPWAYPEVQARGLW
jgi:STIP1 family protein 1